MKNLKNKVAVVTGSGSGIGRELAIELAALGCHLAISDVNEKGLEETSSMLKGASVKITTHILDVSNKEAFYAHAEEVKKAHGHVDLVINNAGVAMSCPLETTEYEDFEWLMNINFWGVVYGSKAFLPMLKERSESRIVNISSIYGITPVPFNGPYVCSKFAVRGFTETLMSELKNTNVGVSVVHPGGIKTRIAMDGRYFMEDVIPQAQTEKVYEEKFFKTTANQAARVIIKGIRKNKKRIMVGSDAKVIDWLRRLIPMISLGLIGDWSEKTLRKGC